MVKNLKCLGKVKLSIRNPSRMVVLAFFFFLESNACKATVFPYNITPFSCTMDDSSLINKSNSSHHSKASDNEKIQ